MGVQLAQTTSTVIRPVLASEIHATLPLMREYIAAIEYPIVFDGEKSEQSWLRLYELERGQLFGLCHDTKFVGVIGVQIAESIYGHGQVVNESIWWVQPDHRKGSGGVRLLDAGEAWRKSKGIPRMTVGCFAHLEGDVMTQFFTRRGYVCKGATFLKDFNDV
jgi:GNAT superfamily N-acetyltransferase